MPSDSSNFRLCIWFFFVLSIFKVCPNFWCFLHTHRWNQANLRCSGINPQCTSALGAHRNVYINTLKDTRCWENVRHLCHWYFVYKITKAIFIQNICLKCYFELVSQRMHWQKAPTWPVWGLLRLCHLDSQPGCVESLLSLGLSFQDPNFLAQFRFKDMSDNNIWQFRMKKFKPNWIEKSHRVFQCQDLLEGNKTKKKKKKNPPSQESNVSFTWEQLGTSSFLQPNKNN